jgi:hypothetical protein
VRILHRATLLPSTVHPWRPPVTRRELAEHSREPGASFLRRSFDEAG